MQIYRKGQIMTNFDDVEFRPQSAFIPTTEEEFYGELEVIHLDCEVLWYVNSVGKIIGRGVFVELPNWRFDQHGNGGYVLLKSLPYTIQAEKPVNDNKGGH